MCCSVKSSRRISKTVYYHVLFSQIFPANTRITNCVQYKIVCLFGDICSVNIRVLFGEIVPANITNCVLFGEIFPANSTNCVGYYHVLFSEILPANITNCVLFGESFRRISVCCSVKSSWRISDKLCIVQRNLPGGYCALC